MELQKKWSSNEFSTLTDENIRRFASDVAFDSEIPLNKVEEQSLRDTVTRYLTAYREGASFSDIMAFVLPITNGSFVEKRIAFDREKLESEGAALLKVRGVTVSQLATMPPLDVLRLTRELPSWAALTNAWTRLGLQGAVVVVRESAQFPALTLLRPFDVVTTYRSTNVASLNFYGYSPRFAFSPSPTDVVTKHSTIKHALIWVVVASLRKPPQPAYCQLYFDPDTAHWLPCYTGRAGDDSYYMF